jgi:hypothetical protein
MNDSEQQRENKKMRAFVRTWRESRDHAFELFDVVLDVVSRVPMLKEKRLYPPSSEEEEEEEEEECDDDENNGENESVVNIEKEKRGYRRRVSSQTHRETVAKQMEQLGVILEKLDRERDRMKQFVDEMEKVVSRGNREQTQSRKTGGGFDEKSQASSHMFESMERIEASWRFYGEETSACEALFGLCREAAEEAAEEKKKKKNDGGEASDGGEMVRSARAFLEVRRKVDLERRWIV